VAEELLGQVNEGREASDDTTQNLEDQEDELQEREDEDDSYNEVIFGKRRPDSNVIDWANRVIYVLEFKRVSDQRRNYRHRGELRATKQHDILMRSLEIVAKESCEHEEWKVGLIIFVGGTCGSVHTQTFNENLKELQVLDSKRPAIRKGLVHELLNAQDSVLCSYFAQRSGEQTSSLNQGEPVEDVLQKACMG
jgi:hypothetical protein